MCWIFVSKTQANKQNRGVNLHAGCKSRTWVSAGALWDEDGTLAALRGGEGMEVDYTCPVSQTLQELCKFFRVFQI